MEKVLLTYSGGLDTTVAIHWLKNVKHCRVIALAVNIGQGRDLDVAAERALSAGADGAHVVDLRRTFLKSFCWKALRAGAKYEGVYLLSAALSRPLIATEAVRLAHEEGLSVIAHGAPPRGNDQFRIESSITALDPQLEIMAPLRMWPMRTREEVRQYAAEHGLEVDPHAAVQYTRDANLWGTRCSGGDLADIHKDPNEAAYVLTQRPQDAPNEAEDVVIEFVKGEPQKINGERLGAIEVVEKLNVTGGIHGIGRLDIIEHNLMGFKTREVYEAPAATILYAAHDALERLVLDKMTLNFKRSIASVYADAIYEGHWFSTLRESLDAFVTATQEFVTGEVTIRLFKGSLSAIRGNSEFSTYDRELMAFEELGGALPKGAAEGMLSVARLLQRNRAFKQRPRT